jgi:hypothetical protein
MTRNGCKPHPCMPGVCSASMGSVLCRLRQRHAGVHRQLLQYLLRLPVQATQRAWC